MSKSPLNPGETLDSSWGSPAAKSTLAGGARPSTSPEAVTLDAQSGPSAGPSSDAPCEPSIDRRESTGGGATDDLGRGASIGRYLILSLLGRGGMGEVYAAYDPELDRRVALKLLHTSGGESARRRLVREARALGKLSHPNVVQVHDVGEHLGDVFVAMELVDGDALDVWCKAAPAPTWQEVLAVYLDAALGLSAAHQQGLVHRDVKPGNILRGKDGRVRVLDFGLAAPGEPKSADSTPTLPSEGSLHETLPAPSHPDRGVEARLTTTGALMGTPLYMAPEQHASSRVTPASDQYALCVALHEGLYGVAPFPVERRLSLITLLDDLLARKMQGPPLAPPAGSAVPVWVYRALRRGLSPKPEDRYPALPDLIAALREDPDALRRARRRRAGIVASAAGLLALAVAAGAKGGALGDPCAHPERELAGVWDEGVAGRVRAAFAGTGRPGAEGTATRVTALLDRYGAQWSAMRGEVCAASQSGAPAAAGQLVGLREQCLERRRGQLRALTGVLADRPDPGVLDRAVQSAAGLYPVASCDDVEALGARVRPPEDPAVAAQVAALRPRADRLEALFHAGRYKEGVALGEPLLEEVSAVPYPPLRAEVELWLGLLRAEGGEYDKGEALLRRAMLSAAEGRDDVLEAVVWGRLLYVVGELEHRFEAAAAIRSFGPAAISRARDPRAEAAWLAAEGAVLVRMGKYDEGRAVHERALALREKLFGPDHPDVAASLGAIGNALLMKGSFVESRAFTERALALREKLLGEDHPDLAKSLNNLASAYLGVGDYPRALATHERTLALRERLLGPDHPEVANSLNNLGNVYFATGDYPRAQKAHERALAIREKALGQGHPYVAQSLVNLEEVLLHTGEPEKALALAQRALAIREKALGPDDPDVAETLADIGRAHVQLGDPGQALRDLQRALAMREKALGPTDPDLTDTLLGLAEVHLARHAPEDAVLVLERALALTLPEGPSPEVQLLLADALRLAGRDLPRATALARAARDRYAQIGHAPGLLRATRWLAEGSGSDGPEAWASMRGVKTPRR
jgi:serine/threonine-protein kinase